MQGIVSENISHFSNILLFISEAAEESCRPFKFKSLIFAGKFSILISMIKEGEIAKQRRKSLLFWLKVQRKVKGKIKQGEGLG